MVGDMDIIFMKVMVNNVAKDLLSEFNDLKANKQKLKFVLD